MLHPDMTNLSDDMKKYRYNLIEQLRLKTIKDIKEKRKKMINENKFYYTSDKFNSSFQGSHQLLITQEFGERMGNLRREERRNLEKMKDKQRQNLEYLIEQEVKQ